MRPAITNPTELLNTLEKVPVEDRARILIGSSQGSASSKTLDCLIDHTTSLTAADASKAVRATDIVVNLTDRLGTQLQRARARRARARALSYMGRFEESLSVCREGVRLAEEAGSQIEAGRARLASMHALVELGRLDQAIEIGESAREAFVAVGESALAARADINLGIAHQRHDDPHRAVKCFDRAAAALSNEPLTYGILQSNRGEALVALNDFRGAQAAFEEALAASQQAGADLPSAIFEGNLADLAARQGRLSQALRYFEQARRHLERNAAPGHLARLRAEQADAMSVLGMPQAALREYESALQELDRCRMPLEAARARAGMGRALLRVGEAVKAETALAAAAMAFDELGHITARAKVDLVRAELAASQNRLQDARNLTHKAMAVLHARPADSAVARHLLARLNMQMGRLEQADAELGAALALARELDLAPLIADILHTRGLARRGQHRLHDAIRDLSTSVDHVERVRGSLQAQRFRAAFLGDRSSVYESLVNSLLDQGDEKAVATAFAVMEKAKSRSLLEQIHSAVDEPASATTGQSSEASALIAEAAQLRDELNGLYSRQADEPSGPHEPMSGSAVTAWREAVHQREAELESVESRLAFTGGIGHLYTPTARLHDALESLRPGTALIEYFIAEGRLVAIVLHDGMATKYSLAAVSEVADRIERVRFQMNRTLPPGSMEGSRGERLIADANRELGALYALVFKPLVNCVRNATELVVVPHGPLHMLPFAALWNGQQYLLEQYRIRQSPNASLLTRWLNDETKGLPALVDSPLVAAVSDITAPHILDEGAAIASLLECNEPRFLLGARASTAAFAHFAQNASVIHLACHGRFMVGTPLASGLRLADRWLTIRDIYNLQLRARLVTLSGCETGLNRIGDGDELFGLLQAFLAAGARMVLASLWPVNDAYTMGMMSEFYHLLRSSSAPSVSATLRAAQLHTLKASTKTRHPAFWAPFVLVGRES